eukprot:scaffold44324_cov30-Tisochrysis_lutea.AAC.3
MASVRRGEPSSATLINYKKGGKRFVNQVRVPVLPIDFALIWGGRPISVRGPSRPPRCWGHVLHTSYLGAVTANSATLHVAGEHSPSVQ